MAGEGRTGLRASPFSPRSGRAAQGSEGGCGARSGMYVHSRLSWWLHRRQIQQADRAACVAETKFCMQKTGDLKPA